MENIEQQHKYFRLKSDISPVNAEALRGLVDTSSYTITEHIRRASALYQLSMNIYEEGGNVHSVSPNGDEILPLFLLSTEDKDDGNRVPFSVNLNAETAEFLQSLGVETNSANTTVLDNVINYYIHTTQRSKNGDQIIVESFRGEKYRLGLL